MSAETIKLKEQQVAEYVEKFGKAKSVVLVDYRGLNVAEDTLMRNDLRKANVEYKVIKNRLVLRAFNNAGIAGFDSVLEGPTAMAISYEDAVAPLRLSSTTSKRPTSSPSRAVWWKARFWTPRKSPRWPQFPPSPCLSLSCSVCCKRPFADLQSRFPRSQRRKKRNILFLKNKII